MTKDSMPSDGAAAPQSSRRAKARPMGFAALSFALVLILIVAGMFVWQRIEQRKVMKAPTEAAARFEKSGLKFSFGSVDVTGAPTRVNLLIEAPRLESEALGISWSAERLELRRLVYRASLMQLAGVGPHFVKSPLGELRLDALMIGSLRLLEGAVHRVALTMKNPVLDLSPADALSPRRNAARIELFFREPQKATQAKFAGKGWARRAYFRFDDLELREGAKLSVAADGIALFAKAVRADAPPPALRSITIERARAIFTAADGKKGVIDVAGDLELRGAEIKATLKVSSKAAQPALKALVSSGALAQESADALLKHAAKDGGFVGLLEISNGVFRILEAGPEPIPLAGPKK
ncbi:MAG: DUF2125 domain-containing protein [Neomegalonema sp.]|nr:DUF2125 domain-containing protein [Neomegalonema sp.]